MSDRFKLRVATLADTEELHRLIALSVRGLMSQSYSPSQLEAALGNWLGLDTQLIIDGTYYIVETSDDVIAGCGGWSMRKTPYGSDHRANRENELLDPATDAAKIRAFFVHPDHARQGIGKLLLDASEAAAIAAGFRRLEMGATLSGVPLYERFGYTGTERVDLPLGNGEVLPILKMSKKVP